MGDDCCEACGRWGEREADPIIREILEVPRALRLVVLGTGETIEISAARPEIRVGRVQGNDLVLPKGSVSKRQMRFLLEGGAVYAEDLRSACGTFVDGRKISERTRLGRGAVVSFADFHIKLVEL